MDQRNNNEVIKVGWAAYNLMHFFRQKAHIDNMDVNSLN